MQGTDRTVMMHFPNSQQASSLKIIQEPTSQIRAFYFKKSLLAQVEELEYANNYAIYFLFSDLENPSVYIGQSTQGIKRLRDHLREKDFWQYGILFVTDNNSFDKLAIDFLEHQFIQLFKRSSFIVENRDLRNTKPTINWFAHATMNTFTNQITFLLEALGVSIQEEEKENDRKLFPAEGEREASLYIHDGQFFLTKGSILHRPQERLKNWNDQGKLYYKLNARIDQLIDVKQAEVIDGGTVRLLQDVVCSSPSAAADLCSGTSKNGWTFWRGLEEVGKNFGR
ncbi:GIY-YIG nuclease family protein [Shouchella clausii]